MNFAAEAAGFIPAPMLARPAHVLLVDDDPTMRELAKVRLGALGYALTESCDGGAAWELLKAQTFDLAIIDLKMPRLNGFELIELIRSNTAHRHMPVIVITTLNDTDSIETAFGVGATTFVTKPLNWTLFGHQVRYVLRSSQVEQELRRAKEQAEQVNASKDDFMSVMSHELRTPLNAIVGFAEVLSAQSEGSTNSETYRTYLNEILGGGRRLLATLNEVFLFSRIMSNTLVLREGEYTLDGLESEVLGAVRTLARTQGIALTTTGFEETIRIDCDLSLLGQALSGLMENAVKFSPADGEVRMEATMSMDGRLVIAIRDQGPGMDPEDVASYMAPFTQSDMSLRRSAEGLGLGLTIANTLVRLHRGELLFDRGPRGGTVARIVLPKERVSRLATT